MSEVDLIIIKMILDKLKELDIIEQMFWCDTDIDFDMEIELNRIRKELGGIL